MADSAHTQPNALVAYTVIMLEHGGRYLLLRRAETKRFAPGRWTGIGGMVERDEFADLRASALRELAEESGIAEAQINHFVLRRALLLARPGGNLTLLLYYTGSLAVHVLPACPEGTLAWVAPEELPGLDVIESTRPVLPLLIADLARDPLGRERVHLGLAEYRDGGSFEREVWV